MNIYFLPAGENDLHDELFDPKRPNFWQFVAKKSEALGEPHNSKMVFHTIDLFDPAHAQADDIFVVLDHPEESPFWRLVYLAKYWRTRGGYFAKKRAMFYHYQKYFKRKILLQGSPPVITVIYRNLAKLRRLYTDIYFPLTGYGPDFHYFHYEYDNNYRAEDMIKKYFHLPKTKFIVMIGSNCLPHLLDGELYGERIKAIKYWSQFPDFDLYGLRWDALPKNLLHLFDGPAIRRRLQGASTDRWGDMSHYKFALVYEAGAYPGWITEKIFDCFVTGAVPVYLGAPDIKKYIPANCFVNVADFPSYDALNTFLRGLTDQDIEKYRTAILEFFASGKDKPFTREVYAQQILETLRGK